MSHPGNPLGLAELWTWSGVLEALASSHHGRRAGKQLSGSCQSMPGQRSGSVFFCHGCRCWQECSSPVHPQAPCQAPCPWLPAWGGHPSPGCPLWGDPALPLPTTSFHPAWASRAARDGATSSARQWLCLSQAPLALLYILAHQLVWVNNTQPEPQHVVGTSLCSSHCFNCCHASLCVAC